MFDVIPLYRMNLEVYIGDINKVDTRIATFTHKKGVSNYDLSKEQIKGITKGKKYLLVVKDLTSNIILYTQEVAFSDFEIRDVYYYLGFITIYKTVSKISDLQISDSYGIKFNVTDDLQIIDEKRNELIIVFPQEANPGYYTILYEEKEFGKFFYSYGLDSLNNDFFDIYPISAKNSLIITSFLIIIIFLIFLKLKY